MQPDSVDICPELISSEISEPLPTQILGVKGQRGSSTRTLSLVLLVKVWPPDDSTTLSPVTRGAELWMGAIWTYKNNL